MVGNKIPKSYIDHELYTDLKATDDPDFYYMNPRLQSFEVSYKGYLIFSKLGGRYWPNIELVANKCAAVAYHEAHKTCNFTGFLAGMSPKKDGKFSPCTRTSSKSNSLARDKSSKSIRVIRERNIKTEK